MVGKDLLDLHEEALALGSSGDAIWRVISSSI